MKWKRFASVLAAGLTLPVFAQYPGWQHEGSLYILTTPEGANLPAGAAVEQFPLLVKLNPGVFDFSQAKPNGEDIRFSAGGKGLAYQVEEWDAAKGTASVWVRIPVIQGNARQALKVHWGKPDAASESSGKAVFNESNGYLSVWHMGASLVDEVGTLGSTNVGTVPGPGMVGAGRHFAEGKGIFCGKGITNYPAGAESSTTEAWFRAEKPNVRVIGWGKEQSAGKIIMFLKSPPHIDMDCFFANVEGKSPVGLSEWHHVVHTYQRGDSRIYVDGQLDGATTPMLKIPSPVGVWIGGWYDQYSFAGDMDEVRISKVARSADWVRLEYENQKPLQTLVGGLVAPGSGFSVAPAELMVAEGQSATLQAEAGGAQKVYWVLQRAGQERIVAVDQLTYTFAPGRVAGDESARLLFKAVYANEVKTREVPVRVREAIPEPVFALKTPGRWDGRETLEVVPEVANASEMAAKGAGHLNYSWTVSDIAVVKEIAPGKLILKRAQNSGKLKVTLALNNGGAETVRTTTIEVNEPKQDAWVERTPAPDEKPVDNQFYARDDQNAGTLYYNGTLKEAADAVFLKVYADETLIETQSQKLRADNGCGFKVRLKPALIKYKVELGIRSGGAERVVETVTNLVCGDAYLIDGQSNALATDTREEAPRDTSEWIRSYGSPKGNGAESGANLWCYPVWNARRGEGAELGYWGMELAKRLVASQRLPICIINGAVGGTRIDQHQRNAAEPADLSTIYGRLLWRVRQAKLTHGIRGILWHQGENDQGAAGPTGGYGWETYQQYFVEMSAAWKQDYPNVQHYYVFQIWPNACSMGGNGSGDMMREVQRTLPRLYSNMGIMSTLGIKPPGPCHYPLVGWAEFARLIQPLIERDNYGRVCADSITPPDLRQAYYTSEKKDEIALEFDQAVVWNAPLASQFYLDGEAGKVAAGEAVGTVLKLKLKEASAAEKITYLKDHAWDVNNLLYGGNGIAALTFCNVPISRGPGAAK